MQLNSISFIGTPNATVSTTISSIPANTFNLSMQITGTYANLLSMVATLDKYPQKILIYSINFQGATTNTNGSLQSLDGTISMNAIVFYAK